MMSRSLQILRMVILPSEKGSLESIVKAGLLEWHRFAFLDSFDCNNWQNSILILI